VRGRNYKPPPPFSSPVEGEETSGTNHPPLYPLPSREGNGMCSDPSRGRKIIKNLKRRGDLVWGKKKLL